jgi:hypothetical protein
MKKPKLSITSEEAVEKLTGKVTNKLVGNLLTTYALAVSEVENRKLAMNEAVALHRQAQRHLMEVAKECTERYRKEEAK